MLSVRFFAAEYAEAWNNLASCHAQLNNHKVCHGFSVCLWVVRIRAHKTIFFFFLSKESIQCNSAGCTAEAD